jgi:hypothetical protein
MTNLTEGLRQLDSLLFKLPPGVPFSVSIESLSGPIAVEIIARTDYEYELLKKWFGLTGSKEETVGELTVDLWPPEVA